MGMVHARTSRERLVAEPPPHSEQSLPALSGNATAAHLPCPRASPPPPSQTHTHAPRRWQGAFRCIYKDADYGGCGSVCNLHDNHYEWAGVGGVWYPLPGPPLADIPPPTLPKTRRAARSTRQRSHITWTTTPTTPTTAQLHGAQFSLLNSHSYL